MEQALALNMAPPHILAHSPGPFLSKSSCLACSKAADLQQGTVSCASLRLATGEHLAEQALGAKTIRQVVLGHVLGGLWGNIASSFSPSSLLRRPGVQEGARTQRILGTGSEAWMDNGKKQDLRPYLPPHQGT